MSGTAVAGRRAVAADRPGTARLLVSQLRYALTDLWRTRIVLIFTFAIPLVWLVVIGLLAGNAWVDEATGVRVVQFVTPNAAAMGVIYAAFPTVAISLSEARDRGILKRVRGTPLPAWTHLAGRVGGAVVFAVGSVLTMVGFGVVAYDVQVVSRTLLATLVTLTLGIACFIAGGPAWMGTVGSFFPLKHAQNALMEALDPARPSVSWMHLGVLAVWLVGASLVAVRFFRWDARSHG
jgi:ABC-2 type transport system permease protein